MYISRYSWHMLGKLEFPRQIFEKFSNIKFHDNPSMRTDILFIHTCIHIHTYIYIHTLHTYVTYIHYTHRQTDRQTDRHEEANSPFPQFCQRAHNAVLTQYACFVNKSHVLVHSEERDGSVGDRTIQRSSGHRSPRSAGESVGQG
jgi:hypothetical protein